ncbi:sulfatase modifying factor 1 (C-alpha-formyglycine- generating enzyme 1) [Candidatus Poribacteria bacterium]|nr:sulfatase modifying factor 1 (C-alpha-formyglycine- generating enzyme 1) [Candidatus Poribacteria bacterium]
MRKVNMRVKRFTVVLLVMFISAGCDEDKLDKALDQRPAKRITWKKDDAKMALIPAGSFEMGDHLDGMVNASPVHRVDLDTFYMDVNVVTVGQFKRFAKENGYNYNRWNDVTKYSPTDEHPMIFVNWNDATAYCEWAGKRLPTEAEWEYASRGGLTNKRCSWGDDESLAREYANYQGTGVKDQWSETTAPVGSFKPNGYGLLDMAGNVWEYCSDWYESAYYDISPTINPQGPSSGSSRVLRGGSWLNNTNVLRVAYRLSIDPTLSLNFIGFRCVSGLPIVQ